MADKPVYGFSGTWSFSGPAREKRVETLSGLFSSFFIFKAAVSLDQQKDGLLKNIFLKAADRARFWMHWKCKEPVVLFESDDWGLERRVCAGELAAQGAAGEWAYEETETCKDLEALYECLGQERDASGRPACLTANFIMANPDAVKMRQNGYAAYEDCLLSRCLDPALLEGYREGMRRGVFYPQYHGRYHFSPEALMRDLGSNGTAARTLFENGFPAAMSFIKGQGWRYHSEYLDWASGREKSAGETTGFMKGPLEDFKKIFGFFSYSTIPPHYIFTRETERAWKNAGIRYVQGTGYRLIRKKDGTAGIRSHFLGEKSEEGLFYLVRTVKFDPRPGRPGQHWEQALRQCLACFRAGIPAVIDSHRINYTGSFREEGLGQLRKLLEGLRAAKPLFLTSPELGQAVSGDGKFSDVFSQKDRSLSARKGFLQNASRAAAGFWR